MRRERFTRHLNTHSTTRGGSTATHIFLVLLQHRHVPSHQVELLDQFVLHLQQEEDKEEEVDVLYVCVD